MDYRTIYRVIPEITVLIIQITQKEARLIYLGNQ